MADKYGEFLCRERVDLSAVDKWEIQEEDVRKPISDASFQEDLSQFKINDSR